MRSPGDASQATPPPLQAELTDAERETANPLDPRVDELPDELPEKQKQLVDFAVPGLRDVLGYSSTPSS